MYVKNCFVFIAVYLIDFQLYIVIIIGLLIVIIICGIIAFIWHSKISQKESNQSVNIDIKSQKELKDNQLRNVRSNTLEMLTSQKEGIAVMYHYIL